MLVTLSPHVDFNSHAHVERDIYNAAGIITGYISTHTLTWSVTQEKLHRKHYEIISTHTLTWSVTRDACMVCNANPNFNSHAHVERDIENFSFLIPIQISTHTLTWSVTMNIYQLANFTRHFNSHAHVERDRCNVATLKIYLLFQLTRSRGA